MKLIFNIFFPAILAFATAAVVSNRELALPNLVARELTYDITPDDFSCAIENQASQKAAEPNWDYSHVAPNTKKQGFKLAWEPLLEPVDGCNGMDDGWSKKFSLYVVLDASWVAYYNANKAFFTNQGYSTLETSSYVLLDRVNYLYQQQFGITIAVSNVLVLSNLKEACATNNKYVDDGTDETSTKKQMAAGGYSTTTSDAGILRLGTGALTSGSYCHSAAPIGQLCNRNNILQIMQKPFDDSGKLRYKAHSVLAHELAHYFGICKDTAHCLNNHTANEIPDIMVWSGVPAVNARPEGMFYKFFTTCTPLYRDVLCKNARTKTCGVDVAPPTLAGSYFCTKYTGRANNWHYVTMTEVTANKVYQWKNRANVSWTLTRNPNDGDSFAVSQNCPYYNSGYTVAKIRKDVVGGVEKVTGIYGPWDELYELQ